jgi:hypothetical protein
MRMKFSISLLLALFFAFSTMATAQDTAVQKRVPQQQESSESVQVIDFTSESEPSDGTIYILNDNYYVANSWASLKAKMKLDSKDVFQIRIYMADNPVPANQDIIQYERSRLPEKYRNFMAVATVILKKK